MIRRALIVFLATTSLCGVALNASQTTQTPPPAQPPVPKPFPGSNPNGTTQAKPPATATPPATTTPARPQPQTQTPPATQTPVPHAPDSTPAPAGAPTETSLGVKLFPDATYLESYDAGRGQRLYLFGTNAPYLDVVAFYKKELRGGTELFKEPAMQQFDLPNVKYQKETMAYPPSVVVKDYAWTGATGDLKEGYVFVDGTTEKRYKTIIQIVLAPK